MVSVQQGAVGQQEVGEEEEGQEGWGSTFQKVSCHRGVQTCSDCGGKQDSGAALHSEGQFCP